MNFDRSLCHYLQTRVPLGSLCFVPQLQVHLSDQAVCSCSLHCLLSFWSLLLFQQGCWALTQGCLMIFLCFQSSRKRSLGFVESLIWAEVLWSFLTLLWHILMGQGCDLLRARQLLLCGDQTQPQVFSQKVNWPEISLLKQGEMQFPSSISLNKDHSGGFWTSFSSVKVPWNGWAPLMDLLQWHIRRFLSLKGSPFRPGTAVFALNLDLKMIKMGLFQSVQTAL